MTDRKAWHCPSCGKTHAPHVDTCPEPAAPAGMPVPGSPYILPRGARPEYDPSAWRTTIPYDPSDLFPRAVSAGGIIKDEPDHKMRYA
jgi:hypothetical protein